MQKWRASKVKALDSITSAMGYLDGFYEPASKTYRTAYTTARSPTTAEAPNACTSLIPLIVNDLAPILPAEIDRDQWSKLAKHAEEALSAIASSDLKAQLPLRSFGFLPLFSSSYLAEALGRLANPLSYRAYLISIRRLLFALFDQFSHPWSVGERADALHPFLLYRCERVLSALESTIRAATLAGTGEKLSVEIQADEPLPGDLNPGYTEEALRRDYGKGNEEFRAFLEHLIPSSARARSSVIRALQWIEDAALASALQELARGDDASQQTPDPSSLAFALAVLCKSNAQRHEPILTRGIALLLRSCEHGHFGAQMPFYIDEKGRALFVPSIEIANASLEVALERAPFSSAADIAMVVEGMEVVQDWLSQEYNTIEVQFGEGSSRELKGWCSDRAPSVNRIDAWVTAHSLAFFVRRAELIRWAARREVFSRYSWKPYSQCRPAWSDIVCPDKGLQKRGIKELIQSVVEANGPGRNASLAPMFLLYGPPGTSKSSLVEGLAREKSWDLVKLSPSDFVSESLDKIEMQSRVIFDDLMSLDKCVILFDEIDSLLRDRHELRRANSISILEFVIPALLPKIQDLREYTRGRDIAVFFVTNLYESIDRAIRRGGRIDNHVLVLPYSIEARREVASRIIAARESTESQRSIVQKEVDALLRDEKVQCRLVYQDINRIVNRAFELEASGSSFNELQELAERLGVTSEFYDSKERPRAYREMLAVLMRLLSKPIDYPKILRSNRAGAIEKLHELNKELSGCDTFVEAWLSSLREREGK